MEKIRFVIGTRCGKEEFFSATATGRSLAFYNIPSVEFDIYGHNTRGLPVIYNESIEKARSDPAILVFLHDDIHILDFYWADHIINSMKRFDVSGLAGNKRRLPRQPAWAFKDPSFTWDDQQYLSGVVGHGNRFPPANFSIFGMPGQAVKLLDGLMLICQSDTLIRTGIRFDECFEFHLYDMDFCRQIDEKALSMGTLALSVIHESGGNFGSPSWRNAYQKYLEKWGE